MARTDIQGEAKQQSILDAAINYNYIYDKLAQFLIGVQDLS